MTTQRNLNGPNSLAPDDPGHEGKPHSLRDRLDNLAFEAAMQRAGYSAVPEVVASRNARDHLMALVEAHNKGRRGR